MVLNASRSFTGTEMPQMYLPYATVAKLDKRAFPAVCLPAPYLPAPPALQGWQGCAVMSGDNDKWVLYFILLSFLLFSGLTKMKSRDSDET